LCRSCHRKLHDGKGQEIISSAARVIEDPQTDASKAIAKDHKNSDLMHVEFILCHATVNANKDTFTSEDLGESATTAVNKPLNWEHRDKNIGVIYEGKFIKIDGIAEADKEYFSKIDPLEHDFVVCRAAVWSYKYPEEANIMKDRAEKGTLFFSMENKFEKATCSICNETFTSFFNYCDHLLGRRNIEGAQRIFVNSNFVGAGVVKNPADKFAGMLAMANTESKLILSGIIFVVGNINGIDIQKHLIPFIVGEKMEIKKRSVSENFPELPDEAFADEVNREFPIDNSENITQSLQLFFSGIDYDPEEKLIILERLANAANEYDIDIKAFAKTGGIKPMSVDTNSKEFNEAVSQAVDAKLKELESDDRVKGLESDLAAAKKITVDLETKITELEKAKADTLAEYEKFKGEIEVEKQTNARFEQLTQAGITLKNPDAVKASLKTMTEDNFKIYFDSLKEVVEAAKLTPEELKKLTPEELKKLTPEELKKLEEEKKKKDAEKRKATASVDPVKDSQLAVAQVIDDGSEKEKFPAFDKIIKQSMNLK
jgi:hypothetical protein